MKKIVRSPFFYVGDKYKLMPQLTELFPEDINNYYEPFLGGGSSVLYTKSQHYILNDVDSYVIDLHKYISSFSDNEKELFKLLEEKIVKYNLSYSYKGKRVPKELKVKYKKTYYAKYNKDSYLLLREDFNKYKRIEDLYLLLIYGFNRMIRFNAKGEYNVPVGNVDFNKNVVDALNNYLDFMRQNDVKYFNLDYIEFVEKQKFENNDFIYFDPPYLISNSEYNKLWSEEDEVRLYKLLDKLNKHNIKFGLSNIVTHKG
ncbi:Dam family site-specific DNA-(adenine-N6)-methyltransferase, partial [Erysipelothrix rhusiopathiae]|nr:Dam family site-specific DNA-(adenine-N6)-methyltransferase [Erysipelothrix rhusiopathiae]